MKRSCLTRHSSSNKGTLAPSWTASLRYADVLTPQSLATRSRTDHDLCWCMRSRDVGFMMPFPVFWSRVPNRLIVFRPSWSGSIIRTDDAQSIRLLSVGRKEPLLMHAIKTHAWHRKMMGLPSPKVEKVGSSSLGDDSSCQMSIVSSMVPVPARWIDRWCTTSNGCDDGLSPQKNQYHFKKEVGEESLLSSPPTTVIWLLRKFMHVTSTGVKSKSNRHGMLEVSFQISANLATGTGDPKHDLNHVHHRTVVTKG